jgi:hypothetical protein
MATMNLLYRTMILDKNGKVVKRSHLKNSHSFVINFLKQIEFMTAHAQTTNGTANVSITAVNGTAYNYVAQDGTVNTTARNFSMLAGVNVDTYGIVCGLGTNAVANTDTSLQTQVKTGTATNQMTYSAMTLITTAVNGTNVDTLWSRTFVNTSGGDVAVKEIGVYISGNDATSNARLSCIIRDLSTNTVTNGNSLVIQYIFRTTV